MNEQKFEQLLQHVMRAPTPAADLQQKLLAIAETDPVDNVATLPTPARVAANDSLHDAMFAPWFPETSPNSAAAKYFMAEWKKRGVPAAGMPEGARGYDAIHTIAAAIAKAGSADSDKIRAALWEIKLSGITGNISFNKVGPAGKESGQSPATTHLVKIDNGKVVLVGK